MGNTQQTIEVIVVLTIPLFFKQQAVAELTKFQLLSVYELRAYL